MLNYNKNKITVINILTGKKMLNGIEKVKIDKTYVENINYVTINGLKTFDKDLSYDINVIIQSILASANFLNANQNISKEKKRFELLRLNIYIKIFKIKVNNKYMNENYKKNSFTSDYINKINKILNIKEIKIEEIDLNDKIYIFTDSILSLIYLSYSQVLNLESRY